MKSEIINAAPEQGWIHVFESGSSEVTRLQLQGTGGNETSLLELGRKLVPKAALLSPRGRSLDEGSPRFFRRFSATKYDQQNLLHEADALSTFVSDACAAYKLDPSKVIALGFSNGANIAVASIVRNPKTFAGAILLRPVQPFDEPPQADLSGIRVLVATGTQDPYLPYGAPLAGYLRKMNADVQEEHVPAGHELTQQDLMATAAWLTSAHFA